MFKFMYLVWALLPAVLFYLSASAKVRSAVNRLKKGYAKFYFKQAIYSGIILVVAILVDQKLFYELLEPAAKILTENSDVALTIIAWLIYPMLLAFFAAIQQVLSKKEESKIIYRSYR
jgi:hypothetical protein